MIFAKIVVIYTIHISAYLPNGETSMLLTNTDPSRCLAEAINKISQNSKARILPSKLEKSDSAIYRITKEKLY
jgi:Mg2+/Co2+ transporter CorB